MTAPATAPAATPSPAGQLQDPVAALALIRQGDKLFQQRQFREALFAYQDAVKLDNRSTNALLKLGLAYANLNYFREAIEKWERVLELDPGNQYARGYIERARPRLAAAAPTGPQPVTAAASPVAAAAAANTAAAAANTAAAAPAPAAAPAVRPEDEAAARDAYRRGVALMNARKFAESIPEMNMAIQRNPNFALAYVGRGGAYLALNSYAEARADYEKALSVDPTLSTPVYGLARVYDRLGDKPKACEHYRRYANANARDSQPNLKKTAAAAADAICR